MWEDCPCCGESTFPEQSQQQDGTPVPCGCNCSVRIDDDDYGEVSGSIVMGDGPCPVCLNSRRCTDAGVRAWNAAVGIIDEPAHVQGRSRAVRTVRRLKHGE